jgi:PDZ domain
VFEPTGQIDGVVHSGSTAPDELAITLRDDKTGFVRDEAFFRTGGSFTIHDLPPEHYTLTASAGGGKTQVALDLAVGEHKTGVDIQLDPLVTITGRLVELGTEAPVAGVYVVVSSGASGGVPIFNTGRESVSDATGHFTIKNAPVGTIELTGLSSSDYEVTAVRRIAGTGTIDVGDVIAVKSRLKPGDVEGDLGVHWLKQARDTPPEQQRFEVSWLDPNGAAAQTDLKVGDVVSTVDGVDVSGANHRLGFALMRAPPATKLVLGLARGVTVTIVLSAPR